MYASDDLRSVSPESSSQTFSDSGVFLSDDGDAAANEYASQKIRGSARHKSTREMGVPRAHSTLAVRDTDIRAKSTSVQVTEKVKSRQCLECR